MYCGKFKDVFPFIKNGANIKQDANAGGIPITRIETLAGGEFNTSRLGYANIFDIPPYYEYVLNSGDILMSHINSPEYLGRAVVFEDKYNIVIHGMNLLRLKANKEFIDSRYAVYLFNGNTFKEHIRKITKKSVNQASFSINDLKEIELQLPSIENQVIAAEKLDKLKMLIKKKNRLILFLDEMIKSRFVEIFKNNKAHIAIGELFQVIDGDRGKNYPKATDFFDEGYCLFLNAKNVTKNGFCFDTVQFITQQKDEQLNKGRVLPEDIILTTRGTVGNIAYCDIKSSHKHMRINSGMVILRSKDIIYDVDFITYVLSNQINYGKEISGSAQPQLPISKLKDIIIPFPEIFLQKDFGYLIKQINHLKSDVQKSIDETQLLMDSLMQEYFG